MAWDKKKKKKKDQLCSFSATEKCTGAALQVTPLCMCRINKVILCFHLFTCGDFYCLVRYGYKHKVANLFLLLAVISYKFFGVLDKCRTD